MDIRLIKSFLILAEVGHFGRAAKVLNITQPCLSNQIALLEQDLGGILFDRSGRKIVLTEAGKMLQAEASRLMDDVADLRFRLQSHFKGEEGILSIGYGDVTELKRLSRAFIILQKRYPKICLRVRELVSGETVESVQSGRLDAAIVTSLSNDMFSSDLTAIPVMMGPVKLAIPANHPLASVQEIKRKDLLKTGFIARQPGKTDETEKITAVLESWWENYMGTRDNVIFRVRRRSTAFWLVGAGLGVALLPHCSELIPQLEENLYTSVTNVIFRDVPGLDIQSCTYLVMRNPVNNTVLDKLIECVRETLVKGSTVPNDVPFLPFRQSIPSSVRL